ncbi:NAD(P)/FAD-dependent oxidoreductase [Rhizorhapis sp. SPR117]|uniref:NAD(P)/FAD-dependent oxidoreductase n=1 Tax=Rhizorhapis sp. SPR117 TaxID=2912611 RepID=UPI001F023B5E|nr:FAD-dependent monooxygenase [Rhizorhapis sp. SPR117]
MRRTPPLIIGGGPAGAAAAIRLAKAGSGSTIIERQAIAGDPLCGGFLSWQTLEALETLGLSGDELQGHEVHTLRIFAGRRIYELPLPAPARGVSRGRLDSLLLAKAETLGVVVRRGIAISEYRTETGELRFDDGGILTPESLFLATGKHDLRGLPRPRHAAGNDPMLGLRFRLPASNTLIDILSGHIEMHLFNGGYLGIVVQEGAIANLCMAVRKSRLGVAQTRPAALFAELAQDSPALAERLAGMPAASHIDAIGRVPYGWRARTTQPGIFRLGDQAGVITSLAGEGIGIALASARCAVEYWRDGGSAAASAYQRAFARQLRRPLAIAELLGSVGRHPDIAALPLALLAAIPGATTMIARATRV